MNLPMVVSFVVFAALGSALTSVTGYYVPFVYISVLFMALGTGLLTTLEVDSGDGKWIGYQFLLGMGVGFGLQAPVTAAQTALDLGDIPVGTSVIIFAETLAGAVMVSIAQNVLINRLVANLAVNGLGIDPSIILDTGATQLREQVPPQFLRRCACCIQQVAGGDVLCWGWFGVLLDSWGHLAPVALGQEEKLKGLKGYCRLK
jgi:hypothetical protein